VPAAALAPSRRGFLAGAASGAVAGGATTLGYDLLRPAPTVPVPAAGDRFATLAEAQAATLPSRHAAITVLGMARLGDCRPMQLAVLPSDPRIGLRVPLASGRWGALLNHDLDPMWFGLSLAPDADNRAPFAALSAEVQRRGGFSRIYLPPGAVISYRSDTPALAPGGYLFEAVFRFTGVKNVAIEWQGARLTCASNFRPHGAGDEATYAVAAHFLADCENVVINDPVVEQIAYPHRDQNAGFTLVWLRGGTETVRVNRAKMLNGGSAALVGDRDPSNPTARIRDVEVNGLFINNVEYGLNGRKNLDDLRVVGFKARGQARAVYPYNCRGWYVEVDSDSGDGFQDVVVKSYADPTETETQNTTADITVLYRNLDRVPAPGAAWSRNAGCLHLAIQQDTRTGKLAAEGAGGGSGFLRNIRLVLDVKDTAAGTMGPLVTTTKLDRSGAPDPATRGHVVSNVSIEGRYQSRSVAGSGDIAYLFTENPSWAGETIRNLAFEKLDIVTEQPLALSIAAGGVQSLSFRQVEARNTSLAIVGAGLGVISAANVAFRNFKSSGGSGGPGGSSDQSYERGSNGRLEHRGSTLVASGAFVDLAFEAPFSALAPLPTVTFSSQSGVSHRRENVTRQGFRIRSNGPSGDVVQWLATGHYTE